MRREGGEGRGRATPAALGDTLESWGFTRGVPTGSSGCRPDMAFLMLAKTALPACRAADRRLAGSSGGGEVGEVKVATVRRKEAGPRRSHGQALYDLLRVRPKGNQRWLRGLRGDANNNHQYPLVLRAYMPDEVPNTVSFSLPPPSLSPWFTDSSQDSHREIPVTTLLL